MVKVRKAAALRPGPTLGTVEAATKLGLKKLARRYLALVEKIAELDAPRAARPCHGPSAVRRRPTDDITDAEGAARSVLDIAREVDNILTQDNPTDTLTQAA